MLPRNRILFSSVLRSTSFLTKNIANINEFSSVTRKPIQSSCRPELLKRTYFKIKINRNLSEKPLKPFTLLEDKKPFILPKNPFNLMFAQFMRAFTIRYEMARIDKTFKIQEFHSGAQMALITVSNRISNGSFESLSGLVEPSLIESLKARYPSLTEEEKQLIPVVKDEIANQRVIGFDVSRRHGLHVRFEMLIYMMNMNKLDMTDQKMTMDEYFQQQLQNLMMVEYTFERDYTNGADNSNWLITELNHYNSDYYGKILNESRDKE